MSRQFSCQGPTSNGYLPSIHFYKIEIPCSFPINGQPHYFSTNLPADNPHLWADNLHPRRNTTDKNNQSCNRIKESLDMPHPSVFRCYPSERNCIPRKVISRESLKTDKNKNQKENRNVEPAGNVGNMTNVQMKSTLEVAETGYNKLSHIKLDSRQKVPSTTNVTRIITLNSRVATKLPAKMFSNNDTNEQMTFREIKNNDDSGEILDITTITDSTSMWSVDAETEFTNDRFPKEFNYLHDSCPRSLSDECEVNINHEGAEEDDEVKEFDNKRCADLKAGRSDKSAPCINLQLTHAETEKTSHEIRNKNMRTLNNNLNSLATTNHRKIIASDNMICIPFKTLKAKKKCCQHFGVSPRKKERLSKKLISFAKMWRGKRGMEIKHLAEF